MKNLKITKGKWQIDKEGDGNLWIAAEGKTDLIANICCGQTDNGEYDADEEQVANAELIAEAGNVANETGLAPKELLEQRNELLDICEEVLKSDIDGSFVAAGAWWNKMKEIIKKTTE